MLICVQFNKDPIPMATYVRYVTSHGPRMLFMLLIFIMYTDLFFRLLVKIRSQEKALDRIGSEHIESATSTTPCKKENKNLISMDSNAEEVLDMKNWLEVQKQAIQKLLIYPMIYFGLWIPGIVSRFLEATNGDKNTIKIVAFFMFTIQLIGFANSITYGFSRLFSRAL
ncbi:hypothetical protein HDU97_007010 [Phlyctochytrium planicorne]|nr:hypothetical protein HDU97_007010 [Phlyctochytrium planicorne]